MAKINPVIYVPLLFIKIIWKNVDTFLGIREKMAADLFAILELYQKPKLFLCLIPFYVNCSKRRVHGVTNVAL